LLPSSEGNVPEYPALTYVPSRPWPRRWVQIGSYLLRESGFPWETEISIAERKRPCDALSLRERLRLCKQRSRSRSFSHNTYRVQSGSRHLPGRAEASGALRMLVVYPGIHNDPARPVVAEEEPVLLEKPGAQRLNLRGQRLDLIRKQRVSEASPAPGACFSQAPPREIIRLVSYPKGG